MSAASDLMSALVLEDGRRWGEAADRVQLADAAAILDQSSETPFHFLTRSRGYSKTTDAAAAVLAVMLDQLPPVSRLFALAADKDQGRLLVESIAGFRARTPGLAGALQVDSYRVTATRTGSTLEVVAADAPSAYGLRPSFLIVDELAQWASTPGPRRLWEATTSAMAKVPGSRAVVITTSGDPAHWSYKALEHARSDPMWRTHEVTGPAPWTDHARLAEQRRRLPESVYRRLFENEWTAGEDRLTSLDDLRACVTLDGPLAYDRRWRYIVALDLGIRRDRTVAAVCHAEPVYTYVPGSRAIANAHAETVTATRVVLDRMQVWSGSRAQAVALDDVENWVAQAATAYQASVVTDPWQAVGLGQRLHARGLRVEEFAFSAQSVGRLASTLHLLIRSHALALPDDADLLDELASVRLRETSPGVLRLDHDADAHDDRAVTLAMAATWLLGHAAGASTVLGLPGRGAPGATDDLSWVGL